MEANILPIDSPPPGDGVSRSTFNFSKHGHVAYQIKENHECSIMVANSLPSDTTPLTLGMGSICQNSTFSEHGHVAYHIKGKTKCSSMVANILPTDPPPPPPWGWGQ